MFPGDARVSRKAAQPRAEKPRLSLWGVGLEKGHMATAPHGSVRIHMLLWSFVWPLRLGFLVAGVHPLLRLWRQLGAFCWAVAEPGHHMLLAWGLGPSRIVP